jgi:hypothetical protein
MNANAVAHVAPTGRRYASMWVRAQCSAFASLLGRRSVNTIQLFDTSFCRRYDAAIGSRQPAQAPKGEST